MGLFELSLFLRDVLCLDLYFLTKCGAGPVNILLHLKETILNSCSMKPKYVKHSDRFVMFWVTMSITGSSVHSQGSCRSSSPGCYEGVADDS